MDPKKNPDMEPTIPDGVPPIEAEDWQGLEGDELDPAAFLRLQGRHQLHRHLVGVKARLH